MRRVLAVSVLVAALAALAPAHAGYIGGCTSAYPYPCHYNATDPGSIVAVGDWKVEVWRDGVCEGEPDWVVSSASGSPTTPGSGNNQGGVAGLWEDSISEGSCAIATPLSPGSAVAIGHVQGVHTPEE